MGRFQFESDPAKKSTGTWTAKKNMCFVVWLDMGGVAIALPFVISLVRHLVHQRLHGRLGAALGAFRMVVDRCWWLLSLVDGFLKLTVADLWPDDKKSKESKDQGTKERRAKGPTIHRINQEIINLKKNIWHKKMVEIWTSQEKLGTFLTLYPCLRLLVAENVGHQFAIHKSLGK